MNLTLRFLLVICIALIVIDSSFKKADAQTICYPNGNVIIYSNYDGGYLNIDIDQNIPNLKIGITTYEKCEVNISGAYASNVQQVIYAGYNASNDHCNPTPPTTAIYGVPSAITSIVILPPVTWSNSNGYYYIVCNYSCDSTTYQGGCNTPDQIVHYYLTQFGGSLYYHFTQYGCWGSTLQVSDGGNCCIGAALIPPQNSIEASFSVENDTLCAKDSVLFFNTSFNNYPGGTSYSWSFGDGTPLDTSANPFHVYGAEGTYTVTLIATDSTGLVNDTAQFILTILDCTITGAEDEVVYEGIELYPNPANDHCCIIFNEPKGRNGNLELYDLRGKLVIKESFQINSDKYCFNLGNSRISPGMFFFITDVNGKRFTHTVTIQ